MRRITRKTFERLVCAAALALPVLVLIAASGPGLDASAILQQRFEPLPLLRV
jgi:hypothetical protein